MSSRSGTGGLRAGGLGTGKTRVVVWTTVAPQTEQLSPPSLLASQTAPATTLQQASARVLDPIRQDVVGLLDRAYGVVEVVSTPLYRFKAAEGSPAYDLRTLVRGYDDAPYVIDRANRAVFRVDLKRKRATNIARNGRAVGNARMATPRFLAVGGRDLLILDVKNALWRWRASNDAGKGTTNRVNVNGASQWGNDILAIGTYVRDASRGLYNLYVADPSEQQIRAYPPSADGNGFPAKSSAWLATARAIDQMTSLYIDGDIYITENGRLDRYTSGKSDAWEAGSPGDELLRPTVSEVLVAGSGDRNDGRVYTFDRSNDRLLAYEKRSGDFLAQYRLKDDDGWADLRGMYIIAGVEDQPDRLIWLSKDSVNQAVLEAAPELLGARDSLDGFSPTGLVGELHRHFPGLRIPRSRAVFEALLPSILEQKVTGREAHNAFAALVRAWGEPAPGPVPLRLQPDPEALAVTPYWAFHPLGLERRRADLIRAISRDAAAGSSAGSARTTRRPRSGSGS